MWAIAEATVDDALSPLSAEPSGPQRSPQLDRPKVKGQLQTLAGGAA